MWIGLFAENAALGTVYAVCVGIGATLTIVGSMLPGQVSFTALKALFLGLIVGGVVGLKVLLDADFALSIVAFVTV